MTKETAVGGDFFGVNRRDPGMRVKLPGTPGQVNTYFVRVRSQAGTTEKYLADKKSVNLANPSGGVSSGYYELQIRLRQVDEAPGTTIQYADIRYATNGIDIQGGPAHSPLIGETREAGGDAPGTATDAQAIGNLLASDRNTISVGGRIDNVGDVDFYKLVIDYQQIQSIPGVNDGGKTWATVFDIDYADGLARPDTTISVFKESGELVYVGRDSNIADDQGSLTDLSRGSNGQLDAYIGSVQISEGTYYVAVSTSGKRPKSISTTFEGGANTSRAKLEPMSGVRRIVEDHIGYTGYTSNGTTAVNPTTGAILPIQNALQLQAIVKGFELGDVTLYVSQGNRLSSVNPSTGALFGDIGPMGTAPNTVGDIAMRPDGTLFAYTGISADTANAGQVSTVDPAAGTLGPGVNDAIADTTLVSDSVGALAIQRNANSFNMYLAVDNPAGNRSTLFRASGTGSTVADPADPLIGLRGVIDGVGINGLTRGMAFLNGVLYGVSSTGQFYSIDLITGAATLLTNVKQPNNIDDVQFTGLTNGPQSVNGGAYKDLLFATDSAGRLYALNVNGVKQQIFSGGTATFVNTNLGGATGLAFSTLDINLWHPTMRRSSDLGHGINSAPDNSRNTDQSRSLGPTGRSSSERQGGASFYFGLEEHVADPSNAYFTYGQNAQFGLTEQQHKDLTASGAVGNNYNLPGGAKGALETNSFSLLGYSSGDKPTLYFNYFLETQDAQGTIANRSMRDSARVYASSDNGATWKLVATNNSTRSSTNGESELPFKDYDSRNATTRPNQVVQELFDNTGTWRQARVDLGEFAGSSNVKLRFEFSTAGTMAKGLSGDAFGDLEGAGEDNDYEGFYIDDIIVGFAERGEMVTGALADTTFVDTPKDNPPDAPAVYESGEYQLEIRRGTEIGSQPALDKSDIVIGTYDTNTRLTRSQGRLGDQNQVREQGSLQILNSIISASLENGIKATGGERDADTNTPHPGSVRNLPVLNGQQLVPGVYIANNVFFENAAAAIDLQGDVTPNVPSAPVPFAKIVNNTIYGSDAISGVGISVSNRAAPTILNNIFSNLSTGINVDDSSKGMTVVGTSVFKGNTADLSNISGSNTITLGTNDPLFVDEIGRNFYLADKSKAIDSSLNTLVDRPSLVAVKNGVGLPPSPILAPERDLFGVIRADDPTVTSPPGLGSNIFKDRGAIERIDRVGPTVVLTNPIDNSAVDFNPSATVVLSHDPVLSQLSLKFVDNSTGIDDTTVVSSNFTITRNGIPLTEGVEYSFHYNAATKVVSFNLIQTIEEDFTYELTLNRNNLTDIGGNVLQANRANGTTAFTIMALNGTNDPPVNTVPGDQSVPEDTLLKFSTANGNAISISDVDAQYGNNQAQVTLSVINGIMTIGTKAGLVFSAGDGTSDKTMTFRGTIPAINNALQGLLYKGNANYAGNDVLTVTTSDLGNHSLPIVPQVAVSTVGITVTPVNDAPILDNSGAMTLTAIRENQFNNQGNLISQIIQSAGGNRITDYDAAAVEGIAIHGVNNSAGQWQYSLNNGTSWTNIPAVNSANALLLASNSSTRIRFVPKEGFFGTTGVTFAAWDQTSGSNGGIGKVSPNGGGTAFSVKNESAYLTVTPLPHAITITNFGPQVNFVEKGPAMLVAASAVVVDSQAPIFGGGRLTATLTAGATADDRLGIRNQGTAAGQIGVNGANVSYGGVVFGTISGGSGSNPLNVIFNSNATQAAVQALVQNLTFSVLGSNPSTAKRAIGLRLHDASDDTSLTVYKNLGVFAVNDSPAIQANTSTDAILNTSSGGPVTILPDAVVTDPDSPNFSGGTLSVSRTGGSPTDRISLPGGTTGQISISGSDVFFAGTKFAVFAGGDGNTPFLVSFNTNATLAAVQALVRIVQFNTIGSLPLYGVRSVKFTLTDGDGGTSSLTRGVNVVSG